MLDGQFHLRERSRLGSMIQYAVSCRPLPSGHHEPSIWYPGGNSRSTRRLTTSDLVLLTWVFESIELASGHPTPEIRLVADARTIRRRNLMAGRTTPVASLPTERINALHLVCELGPGSHRLHQVMASISSRPVWGIEFTRCCHNMSGVTSPTP